MLRFFLFRLCVFCTFIGMLLRFNCFSLEFACLALQEMPIAVETDKAKSQHYEVPTSFYKLVLGRNLKYRCAWLAYWM